MYYSFLNRERIREQERKEVVRRRKFNSDTVLFLFSLAIDVFVMKEFCLVVSFGIDGRVIVEEGLNF